MFFKDTNGLGSLTTTLITANVTHPLHTLNLYLAVKSLH